MKNKRRIEGLAIYEFMALFCAIFVVPKTSLWLVLLTSILGTILMCSTISTLVHRDIYD